MNEYQVNLNYFQEKNQQFQLRMTLLDLFEMYSLLQAAIAKAGTPVYLPAFYCSRSLGPFVAHYCQSCGLVLAEKVCHALSQAAEFAIFFLLRKQPWKPLLHLIVRYTLNLIHQTILKLFIKFQKDFALN
ncbi:hypothetical protein Lalb_Chr04g0255861 [Lupinus albus]|uniref:Uncharacterized protein n=1 Tax=Lupinus albus TaxID=3870 RepID=A0A6A4QLL7_LUPAL|nr:hypothetical protein Lalb_Chr04g0255861 [Lupinus albus]